MDIPKIFKNYDIRGLVPREINPKIAYRFGMAFACSLENNGRIIIGRDNRKSSIRLRNSLANGLTDGGCDVVDIGLSTTDMVAWAVKNLKTSGGVMITASHLAADWNGFKFICKGGRIYGIDELKKILLPLFGKNEKPGMKKGKRIEDRDILEDYIKALISANQNIVGKCSLDGMRIVFDAYNGMGALTVPEILRRCGAEVIEINTDLKRGFTKQPEPTEESMKELGRKVLEVGADLGVACDGDADRVLFVDNRGEFVPGDEILSLITMKYAGPNDTIVVSVDTSQTLINYVASQKGCKVVYSRVGDYFVTENMVKNGAVFGGQPNGHMKDPNFVLYDSGPFFAGLFSSIVYSSGKNLDELRKSLPPYHKLTDSIVCDNPKSVIQHIIKKAMGGKEYEIVSEVDGVQLSSGKSTILIRSSGSENKLRLSVESKSEADAREDFEKIGAWIK
jgi:phosphomannomutase